MITRPKTQHNAGFSLVELAMSITIIGILIGGVLKGQDVLDAAHVSRLASEVHYYESAFNTFTSAYGGYPGDISDATTAVPGCTTANNCIDGNGDGYIGDPGNTNIHTDQTGSDGEDGEPETTQFWKHLALTDLIDSVDRTSDPASPEWGVTHPKSAVAGGYHVGRGNHVAVIDATWLVLRRPITGSGTPVEGQAPISPLVARALDRKIDDGWPDLGRMQNQDGGICDSVLEDDGERVYNLTRSKNCAPMFRLPM